MKEKKEEGVEYIRDGGFGSEANIIVQLRTKFPGIGGTIITQQGVVVALREEFNKVQKTGHKLFLKHAIVKKLEDYFQQRKKIYKFSHIPRPLGSISRTGKERYEAYIYQWAYGSDGFSWGYKDSETLRFVGIKMRDWDKFGSAFSNAGINLTSDCTDAEPDRTAQNVVHEFPVNPATADKNSEFNPLWKRIDFGPKSMKIKYDQLGKFLHDKKENLIQVLRNERYNMMLLAFEYLTNSSKMDKYDMGRLDSLVGDYRLSSLRHCISRGMGSDEAPIVHINSRTESLV